MKTVLRIEWPTLLVLKDPLSRGVGPRCHEGIYYDSHPWYPDRYVQYRQIDIPEPYQVGCPFEDKWFSTLDNNNIDKHHRREDWQYGL